MSIDYRLAPEHKFPAAIEDAYVALNWAYFNAERYGGDKEKIIVSGDSSGGNQAAAVSLMARDNNGPKIKAQVLICPVTDYYLPGTDSYKEMATGYSMNRDWMIWLWNHYISSTENLENPYLCPNRAENLKNLPSALIISSECDPLRDEAEIYGKKLEEAGNKVKVSRHSGVMHGHIMQWRILDKGMAALNEICDYIKGVK